MSRGIRQRWRERGGRTIQLRLPFADIMEFALALLSLSPTELDMLGWTLADRKRLLDYLLRAGGAVQGKATDEIDRTAVTLRLPQRDLAKLQIFARRALPKAASNAAMIDRVLAALDEAIAAN